MKKGFITSGPDCMISLTLHIASLLIRKPYSIHAYDLLFTYQLIARDIIRSFHNYLIAKIYVSIVPG